MNRSFIILAVVLLCGCGLFGAKTLEGRFGTVPGAERVKEVEEGGVQTLSYWVNLQFPAGSVNDYYAAVLKQKGWAASEFSGMGKPNQWTSGSSKDPSTLVPVCAYWYHAAWTDAKKKRLLLLYLTFYDQAPNTGKCAPYPISRELMVTLQDMPFQQ
jgi:hypothetical protein